MSEVNHHRVVLKNKKTIVKHYAGILIAAGFDLEGPAMTRTPERMWEVLEFMTRGYAEEVTLERMYIDYSKEGLPTLRICPGIKFISMCEHHFLPFIGEAMIAYVPNKGKVVGLSKLPQLVQKYALRPQLQEKMSEEIANELEERCKLDSIMVVIAAQHTCEIVEGYWRTKPYVTSTIRGLFVENEALRDETLRLMGVTLIES